MTSQISTSTTAIQGKILPPLLTEDLIHEVVHRFYDEIRRDTLLRPIFDGMIGDQGWPAHLAKMCDFWSATLLRTDRYAGRPLPPHLAIPELGEEHFRRWLELFNATVQSICPKDVADLLIGLGLRVAHSFRLAIAFHRGEDSISVQPITPESLHRNSGGT